MYISQYILFCVYNNGEYVVPKKNYEYVNILDKVHLTIVCSMNSFLYLGSFNFKFFFLFES